MQTRRAGAFVLVVSSLALVALTSALAACGGDNKSPSPTPSGTSAPATSSSSSPSSSDGPTAASTGGTTSGDGGAKGDAGYFAGGSALPQ